MTFLTSYMETMLAMATDPVEIELRRKVLDDHLAHQRETPPEFETLQIAQVEPVDLGDAQPEPEE